MVFLVQICVSSSSLLVEHLPVTFGRNSGGEKAAVIVAEMGLFYLPSGGKKAHNEGRSYPRWVFVSSSFIPLRAPFVPSVKTAPLDPFRSQMGAFTRRPENILYVTTSLQRTLTLITTKQESGEKKSRH